MTLSDHSFIMLLQHSLNLFVGVAFVVGIREKFVLKLQKFRQLLGEIWTTIFIMEMFYSANLVQKIDFERPQFQRLGEALTEFQLFEFSFWQVLK